MLSVQYRHYGSPEVLKLEESPIPTPRHQDVLVRMAASSVNAIDWKNRQGRFRWVSGMRRPRTQQGFDVAGEVALAGEQSGFSTGQRVFGLLGNFRGGSLSEYVVIPARQLSLAPANLEWYQVAGLPMAATTAWQALLLNGKLKRAMKVLINGASGGVGHYAIQIAKAYGAEVTAVSGPQNLDLCGELGADEVVNYQETDFVRPGARYDIVFDVVNNRSLRGVASILQPKGAYIGTTPTAGLLWSTLYSRRAHFVAVQPNQEALQDIRRLCEAGQLTTHIDRVYPLTKVVEAHRYSEQGRTRGKVIIDIATVRMRSDLGSG